MSMHIFGIRHHGPGSARSLRQALEALRPDCVLVEGPPDAADALPLLAHSQMKPPVALLIYPPDQPQRAVFYPFAVFSPEWQALDYGLKRNVAVRFMDLPQSHRLAMAGDLESQISNLESGIHDDPIGELAAAAGYSDGERWWEHMVEHRRDGADLFAAILEAMSALRESALPADQTEAEREDQPEAQRDSKREAKREAQREAWMRQTIRAAVREGFERIAVMCGAWHAPALTIDAGDTPSAKEDAESLKGLPKIKTQATWTPWTYGRLSYRSGYGAGVESPGWYHHLWTARDEAPIRPIRWMARVARLMREEDLDVSSAHVIEAVRLAETLAAVRNRPLPGLPELNEATQAVFCFGSDLPLRLIHEKLIVGETLGAVPEETPLAPLQNVERYGNVRGTDAAMVGEIVAGLIARICIGLPGACASLNDEAASAMFDRVVAVNAAVGLL